MADSRVAAKPPGSWQRALVGVLRVTAVVSGLAVVAVVMPRAWMVQIHAAAGLGPYPPGPIVDYLARSTSAFYAAFGGLMWLVSTDLRRYAPVLTYLLWAGAAFAVVLRAVDAAAGMPRYWAALEGPFILLLVGVLYGLRRRAGV